MKTLLLLLLPVSVFCQTTYEGTILNKETNKPVSYATVGLVKENTGINANEQGHFSLKSSQTGLDTLIISSVGFETQRIPTAHLPRYMNLKLPVKHRDLKEVVVSTKYKWKIAILNKGARSRFCSYYAGSYTLQIAQRLHAPVSRTHLSSIDIFKSAFIFNRTNQAIFRVRFYSIDTITLGPGVELCNQKIEIQSSKAHVHIDLESYKIQIPKEDFFVAVEWLRIPYNSEESEYTTEKGKKLLLTRYRPGIGMSEKDKHDAAPQKNMKMWQLNYQGEWVPMRTVNPDAVFSISASVKY